MKNFFIGFLFLFVGIVQVSAQDDMYDLLGQATCECLDGEEITASNIEDKMSTCIMLAMTKNPDALDQINLSDENSATKFGEQVALKMAKYCPNALLSIANSDIGSEVEDETVLPTGTLEGKILGFSGSDFKTLLVKSNGRKKKLLWLYPFDGDQKLLSLGKKAKGKKVKVKFQPMDVYSQKEKEYTPRKVIVGIEFL